MLVMVSESMQMLLVECAPSTDVSSSFRLLAVLRWAVGPLDNRSHSLRRSGHLLQERNRSRQVHCSQCEPLGLRRRKRLVAPAIRESSSIHCR